MITSRWVACIGLALLARSAAAQTRDERMPRLRKQGTATQLVVDGAPFLILGGELGNSTASSVAEMRPIWPRLRAMHLNTVLAPVYWELIEPDEGRYEFASVDSLVGDARANGLRLVLLWFGTWKNSMSTYVPAYVKTNQSRFPRTESVRGTGQDILSPFAAANWEADARAFRALMRHLRSVDGAKHTVLMVQVENEIGMIPTARDHSALADSLYSLPVPAELLSYMRGHHDVLAMELRTRWDSLGQRSSGSWQGVFGVDAHAEELFMAWYFARYAEHVAAAGKAEYPLPMYANAALIRPGYEPGRYVSGGPLPHLIDVWRAAAPSIDFIAPDVYFPNFADWTLFYARSGNPLFVPENALTAQSSINAFYAIAAHDAIGYSPFAIESSDADATSIAQSYALLEGLAPLILDRQGRGKMAGVMPPAAFNGTVKDVAQSVRLGDYQLTAIFESSGSGSSQRTGGGLVIELAADEFIIAGSGLTVTFAPIGPGAPTAGILRAQEGRYENGRWVGGRWLNGDQTHQGRHIRLEASGFSVQRVKLYRYR